MMRILTVRQPWAWAIIHGGKDVENRVHNIAGDYRGPVAIHVALDDAATAPESLWREHADWYRSRAPRPRRFNPAWSDSAQVIGVVNLIDVHEARAIASGRLVDWADGTLEGLHRLPYRLLTHPHQGVLLATATLAPPVGYARPTAPWNGLTVTDLLCGAGGSSSGLVEAGYRVVIAANHWALAIESRQINHPDTDHSQADISQVNSANFPKTHVPWGSPEYTNHSIAKGVKRQRQQDQALFELDGFAADYHLVGSKRDKVKQAGNAVTPPAARDLGHAVAEFLLAVIA